MVVRTVPLLLTSSRWSSSSALGRNCAQLRFASSTTVAENAGGDVPPVVVKKSRAGLWFALVAGAAGIGALAYPQLVTSPEPVPVVLPPPPSPPPAKLPAAPAPSAPAAVAVVEPPEPKVLSPREELDERVSSLREELTELRKQKRNKLVDMKKRSIKDEIKMIENGIKKLEKA